jgi:transposase
MPVIIDRLTGECAQIFVAVMGASNFTYVEATWTQTLGDWIGAHHLSSQCTYARQPSRSCGNSH